MTQTLFDAGARHAQLEQAVAMFDRNVALYRQTVLDALREVEDQLVALRILAEQEAALEAAVTAAREAERIISNQYLAGTVPYTSVVVAQAAALNNAQAALDVKQSRLLAAVALIEALGGGWEAAQLPSRERIDELAPLNFSPVPPPIAWPQPKLWSEAAVIARPRAPVGQRRPRSGVEIDAGLRHRRLGVFDLAEQQRRIAELRAGAAVDRLREQAERGRAFDAPQDRVGPLVFAELRVIMRQPAGAHREGAFLLAERLLALVGKRLLDKAVDKAVDHQASLDLRDGASNPRMIGWQKPEQRDQQQRGIDRIGLVMLPERIHCVAPAAIHYLGADRLHLTRATPSTGTSSRPTRSPILIARSRTAQDRTRLLTK